MPPKKTLWPLQPHTIGKHMVLRSYMNAWLPIILTSYEKAMFVDAFAGPGEYEKGELGSPLIALNALAQHASKRKMDGRVDFVFIEERTDRLEHLEKLIAARQEKGMIPYNCDIRTENKTFGSFLPELVKSLSRDHMPMFAMIDPFGVSGIGMKHIEALLNFPSTEVYVSFMYKFLNRFSGHPNFEPHLDDLFGCSDWQQGIDMPESKSRKEFFYSLYKRQLKASGAKHVLQFELHESGQLEYALFFATKNDLGCDRMKQAMWRVSPLGQYRFRSDTLGQMSFEAKVVDFSELDRSLTDAFGINSPTKIESIEEYMSSDQVLFHSSHLKRRLVEMERESLVIVDKSPRRRNYGFPPGTVLRFVEPPPPPPTQGSLFSH